MTKTDIAIRSLFMILALVVPLILIVATTNMKRSDRSELTGPTVPGFVTVSELDRQLECMTRNIYYEAAREPAEGKLAVAQIVMNRVASESFPNTPCEVIYQKTFFTSRVVCQFSWLCDGSEQRHPRIREDLWNESRVAAKKVMIEGFRLPSLEHALFYHADYVNPQWRKQQVAVIGRHIFYQNRGVRI